MRSKPRHHRGRSTAGDARCRPGQAVGQAVRDAGHEAVGQALLITIGLGGMLAAARLADVSVAGLRVVLDALR